jgi:hypothetical protein
VKIISDTARGILDSLTVAIIVLASSILGLTGFAALVPYALATIHLAKILLTDMPLGAIKIVSMRLHALAEILVGPVLVVAALVFRLFSETSDYGTRDLCGLVAVTLRSSARST